MPTQEFDKTIAELPEYDIRRWFMIVDLEQARDTFRVVEGILEMRQTAQPKRKRRSDAGAKRGQETLKLAEHGRNG